MLQYIICSVLKRISRHRKRANAFNFHAQSHDSEHNRWKCWEIERERESNRHAATSIHSAFLQWCARFHGTMPTTTKPINRWQNANTTTSIVFFFFKNLLYDGVVVCSQSFSFCFHSLNFTRCQPNDLQWNINHTWPTHKQNRVSETERG